MRKVTVLLLTIAIIAVFTSSAPPRRFPPDLTQWSRAEWERMEPSERWFFVHGVYIGAYAPLQTILDALQNGATPEEIYEALQYFDTIYDADANDIYSLMNIYYDEAEASLWQLPYNIANELQGASYVEPRS